MAETQRIRGKKAMQIAVKSTPIYKAIPIPPTTLANEKIMFDSFSPIESVITKKYSPIYAGSCSTLLNSKYATSYLNKALKYLDLKSKEIFSAKCYQKPQ